MFKFIALVISLFLVPSVSSAQSPEAQRAVEFCEARYPGTTSSARLQQLLCIQDQNIKILEARLMKGEGSVGAELARLRKELEATKAELARVREAPAPAHGGDVTDPSVAAARDANARRLAEIRTRGTQRPVAPPSVQPATRVQAPQPPLVAAPRLAQPPVGYVGTPHTVLPAPGQYAAATFDVSGNRLKIENLAWGVEKWARGSIAVRVIVRKNGRVIPVAHPDPSWPWDEIYADLDGDGQPERAPYKAFDPLATDAVHIASVGPRDRIELVYLVDTGKRVMVPGYQPQILWGDGKRVLYDRVDAIGRWRTDANSGWPR